MVKALVRVPLAQAAETGAYNTVQEIAAAERINPSYVSRVLRLTLLAPDVIDAILDGRQEPGVTLATLMEPFPLEWAGQRKYLFG